MEKQKPAQVLRLYRGAAVDPDWPQEIERAQRQPTVVIDGEPIGRIRYGSEGRGWGNARGPCGDCAVVRGEFHVPGCDLERCPACGAQAISCGCADTDDD